ncbi:Ribosomal-protein-alanine acetyltransferase [Bacillus mycoides]|nr:Ribosomal-protein-alanine acetyltransferase [Bacillus mycoides]
MSDKKWSYPTLYTERLILRKIDMSDFTYIRVCFG